MCSNTTQHFKINLKSLGPQEIILKYLKDKLKRVLVRYYKEHGFTIQKKTELVMDNFLNNVSLELMVKVKAMVVADSRANAVRYYQVIKEYIKIMRKKLLILEC